MAAWSNHPEWDFLETLARSEGERSKRISYLLPDGRRRDVIIDQAHDSPEIRAAIGDALAKGRTGIGRKGQGK